MEKSILNWKDIKQKGGQFKENFPRLKETMDGIAFRNTDNIRSGFKACGIFPFSPEVVLSKILGGISLNSSSDTSTSTSTSELNTGSPESILHDELISMLCRERFSNDPKFKFLPENLYVVFAFL